MSSFNNPTDLRTISISSVKNISPLEISVYGIERLIPNIVTFNLVERQVVFDYVLSKNFLTYYSKYTDWSFIIIYCLSLATLLLGYDSFSGERESGTLKLVLTNPVSRASVLGGKVVGTLLVLSMLLLVGLCSSLLVLVVSAVQLQPIDLLSFLLVYVVTVLLLAVLLLFALLSSLWSPSTSVSLILMIVFWFGLISLVPSSARLGAALYAPTSSSDQLEQGLIDTRLIRELEERQLARSILNDEYQQGMMRQAELAHTLNSLSPLYMFQTSLHHLSATGLSHHKQFYEQAQGYMRDLWVSSAADGLPDSVAQLELTGVPPVSWTPNPLGEWRIRCQEQDELIHPSFASR